MGETSNALRKLIEQYGQGLLSDRQKLLGLLKDEIPEKTAEIRALVTAVEIGIPTELQKHTGRQLDRATGDRLVSKLQHEGIEAQLAAEAVKTWAGALAVQAEFGSMMQAPISSEVRHSTQQGSTQAQRTSQQGIPNLIGDDPVPESVHSQPQARAKRTSPVGIYVFVSVLVIALAIAIGYIINEELNTPGNNPDLSSSEQSSSRSTGLDRGTSVAKRENDNIGDTTHVQQTGKAPPRFHDWSQNVICRNTFSYSEPVTCIAFSPCNRYLAIGCHSHNAITIDVTTGRELSRIPDAAGVSCVAFSPDSKYLATSSYDVSVSLWEVTSGDKVAVVSDPWPEYNEICPTVEFSPNGRYLLGWGLDSSVQVWDVPSGNVAAELESGNWDGWIDSVDISLDGELVVAGTNYDSCGYILLWEFPSGNLKRKIKWDDACIGLRTVAISPDNTQIAAGGWDYCIELYDAHNGESIQKLSSCGDWFEAALELAYSNDGSYLAATYSSDYGAKVWDTSTGISICSIGDQLSSIAFSPCSRYIATTNWSENAVTIRELPTGAIVNRLASHIDIKSVSCISFSPDGTQLAAGSWDLSPDATQVNLESYDGTVSLWAVD